MGSCTSNEAIDLDKLDKTTKEDRRMIETKLQSEANSDKRVRKLLLLGTGSSGKSTIFKNLNIIHKNEWTENDKLAHVSIIRRNCLAGILKLLKKSEELYNIDNNDNNECLINISLLNENIKNDIKLIIKHSNETFESYELAFKKYADKDDKDGEYNDVIESNIKNKKDLLNKLFLAILNIWGLKQIKITYIKRNKYLFSFPDNMDYFFNQLKTIFEWGYFPSNQDMLKVRQRTTGILKQTFTARANDKLSFQVIDVGGQRNERYKWIKCFNDVNALLYIAALNHYAQVLFEDEKKNAMIESIEVFYQIINSKFFRKTEIILFLNKKDLFELALKNLPDESLSFCFNSKNECRDNGLYDEQSNYWTLPVPSPTDIIDARQENNINNNKKNKKWLNFKKKEKEKINDESEEFKNDIDINDDITSDEIIKPKIRQNKYDNNQLSSNNIDNNNNNNNGKTNIVIEVDQNGEIPVNEYCDIYKNKELYLSNKNNYKNGIYKSVTDDEWFNFVYTDYIMFIIEQYINKDKFNLSRKIYAHITVATDPDNIERVFWYCQNIVMRKQLLKHGLLH